MTNLIKLKIRKKIKSTRVFVILARFRNFFRLIKYYIGYFRIRGGINRLSDIQVISIEFSSICNLRCRYCRLEKGSRPDFLPLGIYKKLLDEICQNRSYNVKIMEWSISGCFFLYPQYKDMVRVTGEYKSRYPHFSPWVILNDNMMLFDKDKADFILAQGVVNQIICSIDGVDKGTFERIRPGADFEKVLKNTLYLLDARNRSGKNVVIHVNNGVDNSSLSRDMDPRLAEILNRSDHVTRWEPIDWNESFHDDPPRYHPAKRFCSFVFESITLSTSGMILKCCMDLKGLTEYGDFSKDILESIWLSDKRKAFLELMYEGRRNSISGCNNCSITYVGQNKRR